MFSALRQTVNAKPSLATLQADLLSGLTIGIIALPGRRMVEIRDRAALLDCSEAA